MDKTIKKVLTILLILLVVGSTFLIYKKIKGGKSNEPEEIKEEDNIKTDTFNYVLYDNKTELYKNTFKKLKEELTKPEINDLEYAKLIGELFVIDFYSLDDKKTNSDIGGLDFILDTIKENFTLKANDTIYKYIESNVYGDRQQELPIVKEVVVTKIEPKSVNIGDLSDENGYGETISITYGKDLGYPNEVSLSLIHKDKKIFVIEVK